VAHVWTAAIVAAFAVVITGAFAFNAVDAKSDARAELQAKIEDSKDDVWMMMLGRLESIERELKEVRMTCAQGVAGQPGLSPMQDTSSTPDMVKPMKPKPMKPKMPAPAPTGTSQPNP
jgi:hypothetical protein